MKKETWGGSKASALASQQSTPILITTMSTIAERTAALLRKAQQLPKLRRGDIVVIRYAPQSKTLWKLRVSLPVVPLSGEGWDTEFEGQLIDPEPPKDEINLYGAKYKHILEINGVPLTQVGNISTTDYADRIKGIASKIRFLISVTGESKEKIMADIGNSIGKTTVEKRAIEAQHSHQTSPIKSRHLSD